MLQRRHHEVGSILSSDAQTTSLRRAAPLSICEQTRGPPSGNNVSMDTNTLIIIVLVVLLLGGGGFFYRGRR